MTVFPPLLARLPEVRLLSPAVIIALCAIAAIGTVLLLPGRREKAWRGIGAIILTVGGLIFAALLIRLTAGEARTGIGPYFWIFSAIALAGAVRVITHPKPVYSALYFVMTVFATAGLFVLMSAEFMAAALVLIYAGAILVTYVFVIMLASEVVPTSQSGALGGLAEHDAVSREPLAACAIGFALMAVLLFVVFDRATELKPYDGALTARPGLPASFAIPYSDGLEKTPELRGGTQALGRYLFNDQVVNLELAGLILTLGMVGAIVISRRRVVSRDEAWEPETETVVGPATPVDDNPHSIPVYGTDNPRQKAYPET